MYIPQLFVTIVSRSCTYRRLDFSLEVFSGFKQGACSDYNVLFRTHYNLSMCLQWLDFPFCSFFLFLKYLSSLKQEVHRVNNGYYYYYSLTIAYMYPVFLVRKAFFLGVVFIVCLFLQYVSDLKQKSIFVIIVLFTHYFIYAPLFFGQKKFGQPLQFLSFLQCGSNLKQACTQVIVVLFTRYSIYTPLFLVRKKFWQLLYFCRSCSMHPTLSRRAQWNVYFAFTIPYMRTCFGQKEKRSFFLLKAFLLKVFLLTRLVRYTASLTLKFNTSKTLHFYLLCQKSQFILHFKVVVFY